jgi:guanylate kinase
MAVDSKLSREAVGRRGLGLILSSPSGAGKTTLTRMLLQKTELDLTLSISLTTRKRRSSEADGIHYHFIERTEFNRRRDAGELLEFAEVHGNGYGTPRGPVEAILAQGRDVLFDIDYQGTRQVREKMPDDVVTVFILPPSMRELRARLERRAEDSPTVIANRLENARHEIGRWADYDFVLINDDIQTTFDDLLSIVRSERLRRPRVNDGISGFVSQLLNEEA